MVQLHSYRTQTKGLKSDQPQKQAPEQRRAATTLLYIGFQCDHKGCGLPIVVHIVADAHEGTDERKRLTSMALHWKPAKSCVRSHPATSLTEQFGLITTFDDLVWEASASGADSPKT